MAYKGKDSAPAGFLWNKALRAGWRPTISFRPLGIRWRLK